MQWKRAAKRSKKIRVNPLKIVVPILLVVVFILSSVLISSKFFIVKIINVQKEKIDCASDDQIKNASNILGKNILFINPQEVNKNLKNKFICIKEITLEKKLPNKIELKISSRIPVAILVPLKEATSSGELENLAQLEASDSAESSPSANFNFSTDNISENFIVDSEGVIYSNNIEQVNAPKIYVSGLVLNLGQKISGESINSLLKILEKIKIFGVDIKDAKMYSEKTLLVNGVPRIIFGLGNSVDIQIASLQLILNKAKINKESLEFIDLRFDKPIVKIAPKKK